ncbi:MAG: hypothetical protein LBV29_03000 [Azoarcus sp.]|jgi:hypothetical protein|nr:hypothetical protein [Azoarcus sp.]
MDDPRQIEVTHYERLEDVFATFDGNPESILMHEQGDNTDEDESFWLAGKAVSKAHRLDDE